MGTIAKTQHNGHTRQLFGPHCFTHCICNATTVCCAHIPQHWGEKKEDKKDEAEQRITYFWLGAQKFQGRKKTEEKGGGTKFCIYTPPFLPLLVAKKLVKNIFIAFLYLKIIQKKFIGHIFV